MQETGAQVMIYSQGEMVVARRGSTADNIYRVSPGLPTSVMSTDQNPNKLSLHRKAFCDCLAATLLVG